MPSSGVRKAKSTNDIAIRGRIENHKDFIESLKPFQANLTSAGLGGTTGGGGTPAGNYLPIPGGIMQGIIGSISSSVAISSGDLDIWERLRLDKQLRREE